MGDLGAFGLKIIVIYYSMVDVHTHLNCHTHTSRDSTSNMAVWCIHKEVGSTIGIP